MTPVDSAVHYLRRLEHYRGAPVGTAVQGVTVQGDESPTVLTKVSPVAWRSSGGLVVSDDLLAGNRRRILRWGPA